MKKEQIKKIQEYRKYPDKYIEDILGIKLHLFQRIYIRCCNKVQNLYKRGIL